MRRLRALFIRFGGLFTRASRDCDMAEEFNSHFAMHVADNVRAGMSASEARRQAQIKFGGLEATKESYRDMLSLRWIETLLQDVRFGMRTLRRSPVWTLIVGGTLALGIGLSTAIFSIVYSVLLQPLPYPEPDRLMTLWSSSRQPGQLSRFSVIGANWVDWRVQTKAFEDIALVRNVGNFNLTGSGAPERLQGARTSANLLKVLRVAPLFGRMYTEEEVQRDAHVAVFSYSLWQQRFAGDPAIVGRKVRLNGEPFEVIGVMPRGFAYPAREFQLWTPLYVPPDELRGRAEGNYRAIGRLRPGISLVQAQADISRIMQGLEQQYPVANRKLGALVEPLFETTVGDARKMLRILLAASLSLLLIGALNLSILLMGRASARARELTVRAALGAGAGRIRRQIVMELLPLSFSGVAGGIAIAYLLLQAALPWLPANMPRIEEIGLHQPVLWFSVAISLLTVLAAALLPAQISSRFALAQFLQSESRGVSSKAGIRNALVSAQVAIAFVLVFGAGLLARSMAAVLQVDPGFTSDGVLSLHLAVARAQYREDAQVAAYYERLVDRVKSIPGVRAAAFVNRLPLSGNGQSMSIQVEGRLDTDRIMTDTRSITSQYFSALAIPLLGGRGFTDVDREARPSVAIIDERLARQAFDGNALGKRFRFNVGSVVPRWIEIVGVAGHIRNDTPEEDSRPQIYFPEAQRAQDRAALVVRTQGDPAKFAPEVVRQIRAENPEQAVYDVRTMREWMSRALGARTLITGLIPLFGGAALLLACLGLYGVVSYTASLRSREFGIRLALGANPAHVRSSVLGHASKLTIYGLMIGLILTWPASQALESFLFGVKSTDPVTLAAVPMLLLAVAALAALVPAWKASRTDPMEALRCQ